MEEFLKLVVARLIDYPDEAVLTKEETPRRIIFRLQLRQSDIGKVIGKHGHTIASIRNLLNAAASRHGQRATLEILEESGAAHSEAQVA